MIVYVLHKDLETTNYFAEHAKHCEQFSILFSQ